MNSLFEKEHVDGLAARIRELTPESQPLWGRMDVAEMMAHCHVTFEMVFPERSEIAFKKATGVKGWLLRKFVKPMVVGEKPYKKNLMTAPEFKVVGRREFEVEQARLLESLALAHSKGEEFFEGLESPSFGAMTAREWSNTLHKHTDHHLQQFGV